MRKLTQKEIDDAPSWAVSYDISELNCGGVLSYHERHYGFTLPLPHATPQRKEFDISEYEFEYLDCIFVDKRDNDVGFIIDSSDYSEDEIIKYISEQDAIALAKHFKLTAEDLK